MLSRRWFAEAMGAQWNMEIWMFNNGRRWALLIQGAWDLFFLQLLLALQEVMRGGDTHREEDPSLKNTHLLLQIGKLRQLSEKTNSTKQRATSDFTRCLYKFIVYIWLKVSPGCQREKNIHQSQQTRTNNQPFTWIIPADWKETLKGLKRL